MGFLHVECMNPPFPLYQSFFSFFGEIRNDDVIKREMTLSMNFTRDELRSQSQTFGPSGLIYLTPFHLWLFLYGRERQGIEMRTFFFSSPREKWNMGIINIPNEKRLNSTFPLFFFQVTGIKGEVSSMHRELTLVHHVKDDMEDLRDMVERMEDQHRIRKNHLLQQVTTSRKTRFTIPVNLVSSFAARVPFLVIFLPSC